MYFTDLSLYHFPLPFRFEKALGSRPVNRKYGKRVPCCGNIFRLEPSQIGFFLVCYSL